MEWTRDEWADIRRAEHALERIRRSLKGRGKWWAMWRLQDVQHELQRMKAEGSRKYNYKDWRHEIM